MYLIVAQLCDGIDRSQYEAVGQAYQTALEGSHFDAHYSAVIPATASSLNYTITGTPAIKVKARAPQNGETGWLITVRETRTPPPLLSQIEKVDGMALGVERGHAALVTVRCGLSPGVRLFPLTGEQTQSDIDLGVVERLAEGAHPCTIRVLDRRVAVRRPEITIPSVTVFSEDGSKAWTYDVFGSGRVGHTNGVSPSLDPGRYAIVPGRIDGNVLPARILGEIRRTKGIPAGIPVLTVTAAGANTLEVSLAPVIDIGMAFPAFP